MRSHFSLRWGCALALLGCGLAATDSPVQASEPAGRFLKSLMGAEEFELAVLYLDSLAARQAPPAELAETLRLEQGLAHLAAAHRSSDPEAYERHMAAVRQYLAAFRSAHPAHPAAAKAGVAWSRALAELAKRRTAQSQQPRNAARKTELVREARELFEEARQLADVSVAEFERELARFPAVLDPGRGR